MGRKFYGNLDNRLAEGKQFCDEITVGMGVTEYFYSDRHAYEVIAVKDQKHVTIRRYDVKNVGGDYSNKWEYISNPENATFDLVKRGDVWFFTKTITAEDYKAALEARMAEDPKNGENLYKLDLALAGFDAEKILAKGKQTTRSKANVSFGIADYYYDYEF